MFEVVLKDGMIGQVESQASTCTTSQLNMVTIKKQLKDDVEK
jgi:hypothetical protein